MLLLVVAATALQAIVTDTVDAIVEPSLQREKARKAAAQAEQSTADSQEHSQAAQEDELARFEADRRIAFDNNYKPPEGCDAPQSDRGFVECVNHKMRAKRAFFEEYRPPPNDATRKGNPNTLQYVE